MKVSRIAALLFFAVAVLGSRAEDSNVTLTVDGVTYSNVIFRTVTPLTVTVFHKTGVVAIPLEKLSPELRERFGYDPVRAAAERTRLLELQKRREAEALQQQRLRQEEEQQKIEGFREANAGGKLKVIPYVGDETPLEKIIAEPLAAKGNTFIVCGEASLENYYKFNYREATATHYSLRLRQLGPNLRRGKWLTVYAARTFAKPLVDFINDTQAKGNSRKLVRLKIAITPKSFSHGFNENAELVDWQLLNPDSAGWTPWARGSVH
jgi:hypothetical protein